MTKLYGVLRDYQNHFQPSMKLESKTRRSSSLRKTYSAARTPVQRLLDGDHLSAASRSNLEKKRRRLDPVALLKRLEKLQDEFWRHANRPALPDSSPNLSIISTDAAGGEFEPTPRRYRRTPKTRPPRTWRTTKDPFEKVWSEIRLRLEVNPAQTAKGILDELRRRHPGDFHEGQLRTLQRRVRLWRQQLLYQLSDTSD